MIETIWTLRLGFNWEACDEGDAVRHIGSYNNWRMGRVGRFPKVANFETLCGRKIKVLEHSCEHTFPLCEKCKEREEK